MNSRIVLATSDVFVRRLLPSLASCVAEEMEFRIIDIQRPMAELKKLIRGHRPSVVITEWVPKATDMIIKLGYPTVVADTDRRYPGVVSLDVDDRRVGEVAAQYYLDAGYHHFACVCFHAEYATQRAEGFAGLLAKKHRFSCQFFKLNEPLTRRYMESWHEPATDLKAWLCQLPKPVGIFAVHDPLGRMICEAATESGLRLPDEVAVLGANNDDLVCDLSYPPLSSVSIPWDNIGQLAGKWAQHLLTAKTVPGNPLLISPGPVVTRQSTTLSAVADVELRRVIQYLRDHYRKDITVQAMCRELRISRRSVERKFVAAFRSSPRETLIRFRTESARRLLMETELPMALVAERCGFGHAERFSVTFRQQTGMSPSAFRRVSKQGA